MDTKELERLRTPSKNGVRRLVTAPTRNRNQVNGLLRAPLSQYLILAPMHEGIWQPRHSERRGRSMQIF